MLKSVKLEEKIGQFFSMTGEVRKDAKVTTISYALAMVRRLQKVSFLDLQNKKLLVVGVANCKACLGCCQVIKEEGAVNLLVRNKTPRRT